MRNRLRSISALAWNVVARAFVPSHGTFRPNPQVVSSRHCASSSSKHDQVRKPKPKLIPQEQVSAASSLISQTAMQYFAGKALYSILCLKIPDYIGDETLTIPELMERLPPDHQSDVNEEALLRTMRFLAVCTPYLELHATESNDYAFALTNEGALLQSDVPNQPYVGCMIEHHNEEGMFGAWGKLPE